MAEASIVTLRSPSNAEHCLHFATLRSRPVAEIAKAASPSCDACKLSTNARSGVATLRSGAKSAKSRSTRAKNSASSGASLAQERAVQSLKRRVLRPLFVAFRRHEARKHHGRRTRRDPSVHGIVRRLGVRIHERGKCLGQSPASREKAASLGVRPAEQIAFQVRKTAATIRACFQELPIVPGQLVGEQGNRHVLQQCGREQILGFSEAKQSSERPSEDSPA